MMTHLNFMLWLALTMALLVPSKVTYAIIFKLDSVDNAYLNKSVKADGMLVGLVGDTVELVDGNYILKLPLENGYVLRTHLQVHGQQLMVTRYEASAGDASHVYQVDWPRPEITAKSEGVAIYTLRFAKASFGKKLRKNHQPLMSMAGCTQRKMVLTVSSIPSNAEVWVDGSRLSASTDTTLSYPFCNSGGTRHVAMRAPGYVNCIRSFRTSPNQKLSVACELKPIPE